MGVAAQRRDINLFLKQQENPEVLAELVEVESGAASARPVLEEALDLCRKHNAVLARGINGFEAAKARANQIRKTQNLKWDQIKFKSERGLEGVGSGSSTSAGRRSGGVVIHQ